MSAAAVAPSTARRAHHHPQHSSNASTFSELSSFTEPLAVPINPLVTLICGQASSTQALENQQLLMNSYSSCRRLLDHMKQLVGIQPDETIDLIDNDGKLRELSVHADDYATQLLTARSTYYVLKVEVDSATGEKRYTPHFNLDQLDPRVCMILTNALNALNKSMTKPKRMTGASRQYMTSQPSISSSQSKTKRTSSRK